MLDRSHLHHPQNERVHGKAVFFVRLNPKGVSEKTVEADVACGEVSGSALDNFRAIIAELYAPIINEQQQWGKVPQDQASEFRSSTQKFSNMLTEAVHTVGGGVELRKPEQPFVDQYDLKPASLNAAVADDRAMTEFEECVVEWCKITEDLLAQTNRIKDGEEPGPDTELEYWRTRMSNFNSITEQLKAKDAKLALAVCAAGKTKGYARWKSLDIQVGSQAQLLHLVSVWAWCLGQQAGAGCCPVHLGDRRTACAG